MWDIILFILIIFMIIGYIIGLVILYFIGGRMIDQVLGEIKRKTKGAHDDKDI